MFYINLIIVPVLAQRIDITFERNYVAKLWNNISGKKINISIITVTFFR